MFAVLAVVVGTAMPTNAASASSAAAATASAHGTTTRAPGDPAKTSLVGFQAGNIISDAVFTDESTMTETQIQAFFDSKVKTCVVGTDENGKPFVCLKDFRITSVDMPADAYCDGYRGGTNESAARIIYKVAQSCDINPQVLIVMLQKEQGLVTHVWPSAWRYDKALGQGCPDTAPCDPKFVGFFHQIYGAGRQMQMYMEGRWFTWYAPGKTWGILYHPNASCGRGNVFVANKATSALYYYTPYQPNASAMRAGYGTGDACSSYGNRNFYNYFTDWFGSTQQPMNPCDVPRDVGTAQRQYVTTAALNARRAPATACDDAAFTLSEGVILQARRVTSDGDWIEVQTLQGLRWVSREYLRYASAEESECTLPAGTSSAHGRYVVLTATKSKLAPWAACELRSSTLGVGTVLEATRVSYSGKWLEVRTQSGPRWVARSAVGTATDAHVDAACVDPSGTTAASGEYVVRADTAGWFSPVAKCGIGEQLSAGAVVQATRLSYSGNWLEVRTHAGLRWVSRAAVSDATAADVASACVDPAGTSASIGQYVMRAGGTAWKSPLSKCAAGGRYVGAGTVLQATRVSATGKWLEVKTGAGPRWIPTEAVAVCAQPSGTRSASRQYVVRESSQALLSPLAECGTAARHWGAGTGPANLGVGTVLQATRVSYSGNWLEIQSASGPRWVRSDTVEVCAQPAGTRRAYKQYVVQQATKALISPLAECGTGAVHWGTGTAPANLATGTVLQATLVSSSGKWLQVQTDAGLRWVRREEVTER